MLQKLYKSTSACQKNCYQCDVHETQIPIVVKGLDTQKMMT